MDDFFRDCANMPMIAKLLIAIFFDIFFDILRIIKAAQDNNTTALILSIVFTIIPIVSWILDIISIASRNMWYDYSSWGK
jgi:hypothetical protein